MQGVGGQDIVLQCGVVQITVQSYNTKNRGTYRRMVWLVVWSIWQTRHGWTAGIVVYSIILDNMLNLTQTQESYRNSKQGQHVEESHHIWPARGWICLSRICNRKWLNADSLTQCSRVHQFSDGGWKVFVNKPSQRRNTFTLVISRTSVN